MIGDGKFADMGRDNGFCLELRSRVGCILWHHMALPPFAVVLPTIEHYEVKTAILLAYLIEMRGVTGIATDVELVFFAGDHKAAPERSVPNKSSA